MVTPTDCSEVFRMGFHLKGYYKIDPTGNMDDNIGKTVFCEDGWTHVLRRMPAGGEKVNNFINFCRNLNRCFNALRINSFQGL